MTETGQQFDQIEVDASLLSNCAIRNCNFDEWCCFVKPLEMFIATLKATVQSIELL